jgi:hypothetical protein
MISNDPLAFAVIEGDEIRFGESLKRRLLPLDTTTTISFVLSIDGDMFLLRLSSESTMTITNDNVGNDFAVMPETMSECNRLAWSRFVNDHVLDGIQIKFLLAKSEKK